MTKDQVAERIALGIDARPNAEEALGYLGYAGQHLDEGMRDRIQAAQSLCEGFAPRGVFASFEPGSLDLPGADIAAHLDGASRVVAMAVTIGAQSERMLRQEMALSATDGMLLDAFASSMAEDAARLLHEKVSTWAAAQGLHAGGRFSPGYGDLPLEVQPLLLDALGADRLLGLSLTPANLLVPAKSVTAIIGLFPEAPVSDHVADAASRQVCDNCDRRQTCPIYREGRICHGGNAR